MGDSARSKVTNRPNPPEIFWFQIVVIVTSREHGMKKWALKANRAARGEVLGSLRRLHALEAVGADDFEDVEQLGPTELRVY